MRKEILYLIALFLFGNHTEANLNSGIDYSSLEEKAKICLESPGGVRGRKDEEIIFNINNFIQIESSGDSLAHNKRSDTR